MEKKDYEKIYLEIKEMAKSKNPDYAETVRRLKEIKDNYPPVLIDLAYLYTYQKEVQDENSASACKKQAFSALENSDYLEAICQMGEWFYSGFCKTPKDRAEALRWYSMAAQKDYAKAQYLIGNYYYFIDIPKSGSKDEDKKRKAENRQVAVEWFEKAAAQNYSPAICRLSAFYLEGEIFEQDVGKALAMYEKCVAGNDSYACKQLARIYEEGRYVPRDMKKAFELYKAAGERAALELVPFYLEGKVVPRDYDEALRILNTEKEKYREEAADYYFGICYLNGYGVKKDAKTALECFKNVVENATEKQAESAYAAAHIYKNGADGVEKNPEKAFKFADLALLRSGQSSPKYRYAKACCKYYGFGTPQDLRDAHMDFATAAGIGRMASILDKNAAPSLSAKYMFGMMCLKKEGHSYTCHEDFNGRSVHSDDIAFKVIYEAQIAGHYPSFCQTAIMLHSGTGTGKNARAAAEIFETVTKECPPEDDDWQDTINRDSFGNACFYYGNMLLSGNGVRKNRATAITMLERASVANISAAKDYLTSPKGKKLISKLIKKGLLK